MSEAIHQTPPVNWTDELVARMIQLRKDGNPASAIARILGGMTRNAVIGKLSRLGQVPPARVPLAKADRPKNTLKEVPVTLAKTLKLMDVGIGQTHFTERGRSYNKRGSSKPIAMKLEAPMPFTNGARITLMELSSKTCRWPIGDPQEKDFCFCGHEPRFNSSYCEYHARAAYVSPADQRTAKAAARFALPNFTGLSK